VPWPEGGGEVRKIGGKRLKSLLTGRSKKAGRASRSQEKGENGIHILGGQEPEGGNFGTRISQGPNTTAKRERESSKTSHGGGRQRNYKWLSLETLLFRELSRARAGTS